VLNAGFIITDDRASDFYPGMGAKRCEMAPDDQFSGNAAPPQQARDNCRPLEAIGMFAV
jgi:hypothetical protein